MANKIGYKLVANMTSTASSAPYMGMAIPVGSLAYDNILAAMIKSGTRLTEATAKFFLDAFFEYAADTIAESVVRVNLGDVSVYPMIGGSFDSEDAAFDPTKNTLYVGASFSQEIRDAVAGITPDYMGEEDATAVRLNSEMDIATEVFKVIDGTENFRLAGQNLVVPDGSDESIALYSKDGLTKVSDITVSGNDGGQQLTCKLKGDAAVATGTYKIRIVTHGIDPTAPLAVLTYTVSVITAVVPAKATVKFYPTADAAQAGGDGLEEIDRTMAFLYLSAGNAAISDGDTFTATLVPSGGGETLTTTVTVTKSEETGNAPRIYTPFTEPIHAEVYGTLTLENDTCKGSVEMVANP